MLTKDYVRTSDVIRWGTKNFSNRADRDARLLAESGTIRRLTEEEKRRYFGLISEDVYTTRS
jgi:hypothetical protein